MTVLCKICSTNWCINDAHIATVKVCIRYRSLVMRYPVRGNVVPNMR